MPSVAALMHGAESLWAQGFPASRCHMPYGTVAVAGLSEYPPRTLQFRPLLRCRVGRCQCIMHASGQPAFPATAPVQRKSIRHFSTVSWPNLCLLCCNTCH